LLDQKERKNQEQTISPHWQLGIAFVQALPALTKLNFAQRKLAAVRLMSTKSANHKFRGDMA